MLVDGRVNVRMLSLNMFNCQQFNELQDCYLQKRRYWARQSQKQGERVANIKNREGYSAGLEDFQSVLSTFTRYRYISSSYNGSIGCKLS